MRFFVTKEIFARSFDEAYRIARQGNGNIHELYVAKEQLDELKRNKPGFVQAKKTK